jgi:predicted PhzF superfamily epimerase YddE/YHI9
VTQGLLIYQVDAFADEPFSGNPAAVCILHREMDDQWMQRVAQEMNLSETAFLTPQGSDFQLRWFTPTVEVDLCGHATLAAAHVLWETGYLYPGEEARFHTRSGLLTAQRLEDWIELDFPALVVEEASPPPALLEAVGVEPVFVGRNRFDYLVEVAHERAVREAMPDFRALGEIEARGVMITGRRDGVDTVNGGEAPIDFVSRYFAPAAGITEDPVTGSAHCALGPYWAEKLGKTTLVGFQASSRGGIVRVTVEGDRVRLGGRAVTVLRGEFV